MVHPIGADDNQTNVIRTRREATVKRGSMRTNALIAMIGLLLLGCDTSIQRPARSAVVGALDVFDNPPENAALAPKIGKLANRYLDEALAAGQPPSIEDMSEKATRGALRGLGQTALESGPALSKALASSLRMATGTLEGQSPVIGRIAGRAGDEAARGLVRGLGRDSETRALLEGAALGAGRAMTSGVADELVRRTDAWVGPDGRGPLGDAISAIAARSGQDAMVGILAAVRQDLRTCVPGRDQLCLTDMLRSLSGAAGRGASEGIKREFDWITAAIAFVAGLVSAVIAGFAVNELHMRRRMRV